MRALQGSRHALSISGVAMLLSACSGTSIPINATNDAIRVAGASHSQTFSYTGTKQTFIVPAGVRRLTVVARGAEGEQSGFDRLHCFGFPGRVYAVIHVRPGDTLSVFVGGQSGFNGGGPAGIPYGSGGGGASDVRTGGDTLQDRIIVAAGGGGAGGSIVFYGYCDAVGGKGGGLVGGHGGYQYTGGSGGTQSTGGSGGAGTSKALEGGNGALGQGGGGGGGSSYVEPNAIKSRMWSGWKKGKTVDGLVVISWK